MPLEYDTPVGLGGTGRMTWVPPGQSLRAAEMRLQGMKYTADQQREAQETAAKTMADAATEVQRLRNIGTNTTVTRTEPRRAAYLVGEKGPEVFVPSQEGVVVPNEQLPGSLRKAAPGDENLPGRASGGRVSPFREQDAAAREAERLRETGRQNYQKLKAAEQAEYLKRLDAEGDKIREANTKAAEKNLNLFFASLASLYGTRDAEGKVAIPDNIRRVAAGLMEDAMQDPQGAAKRVGETLERGKRIITRWESHWPQVVKDREQATGKKMTPEEVKGLAALAHQNPDQAAAIIDHLESRTGQQQQKPQGRPAEIPGFLPADQVSFGNAVARNDQLTAEQARTQFNEGIDKSGMPGWLGWAAKNFPGVRDTLDPNTPLRRAGRAVLNKITGEDSSLAPPAENPAPAPSLREMQPSFPKELLGLFPQAAPLVAPQPEGELRGAGGRPLLRNATPSIPSAHETQAMFGPFEQRLRTLAEVQ